MGDLEKLAKRVEVAQLVFEHYSEELVTEVISRQQSEHFYHYPRKPDGLWLSVKGDDDWPSWCQIEGFHTERLQICHVVTLAPTANILLIGSLIALDEFDDEYTVPGYSPWSSGIDWPRVAEHYDGIIIAPYQWERRLSDRCGWYYSWDCASGCIWNSNAITSLRARAGDDGEVNE